MRHLDCAYSQVAVSDEPEPNPLRELVTAFVGLGEQISRGLQAVNNRSTNGSRRRPEPPESSPFAFVLDWVE